MDFPPGGTKVLGQPQVQLWEDRAQSPVKGIVSQHQCYLIKKCHKKSVSGHLDAERQQCVAVFGVVQHLNMRLKRQVRWNKGQAKVPRSKQSEAVGFRNVSGEHHLKPQTWFSVKENPCSETAGIAVWSWLRQSRSETVRPAILQNINWPQPLQQTLNEDLRFSST